MAAEAELTKTMLLPLMGEQFSGGGTQRKKQDTAEMEKDGPHSRS